MSPPSNAFPINAARRVRCPGCSAWTVYDTRNPYRPFCSVRCKQVDLGAWASESYRVGDSGAQELLHHDLADQNAFKNED